MKSGATPPIITYSLSRRWLRRTSITRDTFTGNAVKTRFTGTLYRAILCIPTFLWIATSSLPSLGLDLNAFAQRTLRLTFFWLNGTSSARLGVICSPKAKMACRAHSCVAGQECLAPGGTPTGHQV